MPPRFKPAIFQKQHQIRLSRQCNSVRNENKRRAASITFSQRADRARLACPIQRRGCFIKNDDRRRNAREPRQLQLLGLPAGEARALLADREAEIDGTAGFIKAPFGEDRGELRFFRDTKIELFIIARKIHFCLLTWRPILRKSIIGSV